MLSLFSQLAPMGKFSQPHISSKERFELNLKFSRDSVFLPSHLLAVPRGESSIIQLRWVAANYVVYTWSCCCSQYGNEVRHKHGTELDNSQRELSSEHIISYIYCSKNCWKMLAQYPAESHPVGHTAKEQSNSFYFSLGISTYLRQPLPFLLVPVPF